MAFEITYVDRFSNDAADSGRLEIDCIFLGNAGGHDHAMEQMRFRRSQSLQNGEAIDIRHDEIENDGIEIGIRQRGDCRRSVACARHRIRSALRVSCAGRPKRRMSAVLLPLIRDLTSRKKEEAKLEESRRRLEALFNSAMDAILFLDSNRHCRRSDRIRISPQRCVVEIRRRRHLRIRPDEVRSKHDRRLIRSHPAVLIGESFHENPFYAGHLAGNA